MKALIKKVKSRGIKNGIFSFLLVLILMPIGHALMVLNEILLHDQKYLGAMLMGFLGVFLIFWGLKRNKNTNFATIMGFLGGVLIWTGWVEFSFMWVAEKNNVSHLIENGSIATKREYLVMLSSLGLLMTFFAFFIFTRTSCTFFNWFQKKLNYNDNVSPEGRFIKKPLAITTFIETIMLIWFFYIVLLIVYDKDIAGDQHLVTHIITWGSLVWSVFLFSKLITLQVFDYALRYAIPTVIIFWNFIEILGRWDSFHEIWIFPLQYWPEMTVMTLAFATLMFLFLKTKFFKKPERKNIAGF